MSGVSVFLTVLGILVTFFFFLERTHELANLVESVTIILTGSTLVSGLYVWRRSHDKELVARG